MMLVSLVHGNTVHTSGDVPIELAQEGYTSKEDTESTPEKGDKKQQNRWKLIITYQP
jgi:hypothetical protein